MVDTPKAGESLFPRNVTEIAKPIIGSEVVRIELGSITISTEIIEVAISARMKLKLYHEFVNSVLSPSIKRMIFHLWLFESPIMDVGSH